ncbi:MULTISPECIES: alpha/beta hydrolase [Ramlibacter]|uniref:Alpha/beta hydrolase n=1 Tax=Ramlibacter aquaticus TaxID=2780094 RepID=A0ABR9SDM5_9BURK|nr:MULTISPECIES: alpha/beta hydrolase [Ramlibacter]MBE7940461.1 alpha/beta hydrolase [Ramlibacter aquaticus]
MTLPPLADALPDAALAVLGRARRHATPCGEGTLVWHVWGEGRPLVLLHGGSGSWTHWIRNVEALAAAGRAVWVPDLPGFGDSARPAQGEDADAMVAPLAQGLDRLLGPAAHEILGFSFGGMLAVLLAQARPDAVGRLLLAGPPGLGLRDRRLPLAPWRHLPDEAARLAVHRANLGVLMLHAPQAIDDLAVRLQAANAARDRMRRRRLALTDIVVRTLPQLRCPVDAIYGEEDALYRGTLEEAKQRLQAAPGFGRMVVIQQAGHWVQYEAPAAFNAAVLDLLG